MLKVQKKHLNYLKVPINYCQISIDYYYLIVVEVDFEKNKIIIWHLNAKPIKVPWYVCMFLYQLCTVDYGLRVQDTINSSLLDGLTNLTKWKFSDKP